MFNQQLMVLQELCGQEGVYCDIHFVDPECSLRAPVCGGLMGAHHPSQGLMQLPYAKLDER